MHTHTVLCACVGGTTAHVMEGAYLKLKQVMRTIKSWMTARWLLLALSKTEIVSLIKKKIATFEVFTPHY